MGESVLIGLTSVIVLGVSAQWMAWRLNMPPILFLLVFGLLAGPVTGFLDPDGLLGKLLVPLVSVSVAIILFEGGLSLRLAELKEIGKVVRSLITTGVLLTWILTALAAHWVLALDWDISILLGAILVVTGPTVIGPMLRHVRPVGRVSNILKWEGITIDPVGALLAVLVFEGILAGGEIQLASAAIISAILKTVVLGSALGVLGAWILVFLMRRYLIPDILQEAVTLMTVIGVFALSNTLQAESGLFAVTLMGIVFANQKRVTVRHIVEFKENLRVLIISILFVLLAARLHQSDLQYLQSGSLLFLAILMFVIRPLVTMVATRGSELNWKERVFIGWMAPRGIVAAAVSAIFALRLLERGHPQAEYIVPVTFWVIISTVAIYSTTAGPLANLLGLARANPQGVLFIGAHSWAQKMAKMLMELGFQVVLVDSNAANAGRAKRNGLRAYHGNILSEHILDVIELDNVGRLLAMTPNDEANSLAGLHFIKIFGRSEIYQLPPDKKDSSKDKEYSPHLRGRFVFGEGVSYPYLSSRFDSGATLKTVMLTKEFGFEDFKNRYKKQGIPLFMVNENKKLQVFTAENPPVPKPGCVLVVLVDAEEGL